MQKTLNIQFTGTDYETVTIYTTFIFFQALTDVAKCKALEDEDLAYPNMDPKDVSHFIDRGLLEKKAS